MQRLSNEMRGRVRRKDSDTDPSRPELLLVLLVVLLAWGGGSGRSRRNCCGRGLAAAGHLMASGSGERLLGVLVG